MKETAKECRMADAIDYYKRNEVSVRETARLFEVSFSTLQRRLKKNDVPKRHGRNHLTENEENIVVERALSLDDHGFPLRLVGIASTANCILKSRNCDSKVSHNWAQHFVRRRQELATRIARSYDYKRALAENPEKMNQWFDFYTRLWKDYNVSIDNVYNMDETGFQMGIHSKHVVVTRASRVGRAVSIQPGNKDLTTVIVCVAGDGYAIPPHVIFKGESIVEKRCDNLLDDKWALSVSPRGWTSNVIALDWLNHFHKYTQNRARGGYRLLILDGHKSHNSEAFLKFCDTHKIILACLPPHSSHLTQPLDVVCFNTLKKAYHKQLERFVTNGVVNVNREVFVCAFKPAYMKSMTPETVRSSFKRAGLIPTNPVKVISAMKIEMAQKRAIQETPIPSSDDNEWISQTPKNRKEAIKQDKTILRLVVEGDIEEFSLAYKKRYKYSNTQEETLRVENSILKEELAARDEIIKQLTSLRSRQKKDKDSQDSQATTHDRDRSHVQSVGKRSRCCGTCREPGHNSRSCPAAKQMPMQLNANPLPELPVIVESIEEPMNERAEVLETGTDYEADCSVTLVQEEEDSSPPDTCSH